MAAAPSACPGLDETSSREFALSEVEGECTGWTNERHHAFAPEVDTVVSRITAQNNVVRQRWERPKEGQARIDYVRVAVLMPMTADAGSAMVADTIPTR
jgi:hypothetical protein